MGVAQGPGAPAGVTAFVDVSVIPMDTERVLANQTVLVERGRITALGPVKQIKVPTGAILVDGRGKYLIPSLADMHVHLGRMSIMGAAVPKSGDSVSSQTQQRLLEILRSGVTTVRNMEMDNPPGRRALWLRNQLAAGRVLGPRMYTSGSWRMFLDTAKVHPLSDGYRGQIFKDYDKLEDIAPQVAAYKAAGYDFLKVYSWDGGSVFDSLLAAARRVGLPVAGHVPWGVSVRQALAAGIKSIEHLYGYHPFTGGKALGAAPTIEPGLTGEPGDSVLAALAVATQRAGTWNCPIEPNAQVVWPQLRNLVIKALQDAGAGLLLCTDNHGGPGTGVHGRLGELVQAGLTPYQALVTGTRNPAAYFERLDSSGTVALGKRADLVLLRGNPLADISNTAEPAGVMLGGQWLPREEIDRRLAELKAAAPSSTSPVGP